MTSRLALNCLRHEPTQIKAKEILKKKKIMIGGANQRTSKYGKMFIIFNYANLRMGAPVQTAERIKKNPSYLNSDTYS